MIRLDRCSPARNDHLLDRAACGQLSEMISEASHTMTEERNTMTEFNDFSKYRVSVNRAGDIEMSSLESSGRMTIDDARALRNRLIDQLDFAIELAEKRAATKHITPAPAVDWLASDWNPLDETVQPNFPLPIISGLDETVQPNFPLPIISGRRLVVSEGK